MNGLLPLESSILVYLSEKDKRKQSYILNVY